MEKIDSWLAEVTKILEESPLYARALEAASKEEDRKITNVKDLRGDESRDAFDAGETPQGYADFLILEWGLFGPLGE